MDGKTNVWVVIPQGHFECVSCDIEINAGKLILPESDGDVYELDSIEFVGRRVNNPLTDAQRLAIAVLQGDEEAALAMSDEVQLRASFIPTPGSPRFIPRQEMETRMHAAEAYMNRIHELKITGVS